MQSNNQRPHKKESTPHRPAVPPQTPCYKCLGNHATQICQFKEVECHKCKKVRHVAKPAKHNEALQKQNQGKGLEGLIILMTCWTQNQRNTLLLHQRVHTTCSLL